MKVFVQNKNCPSQVLFAFNEVIHNTIERVRWAVAYSTLQGCQRLVEHVELQMGKREWNAIDKQFITSVDFGITEPEALEFLSGQSNAKVYVANPEVHTFPRFQPLEAYHPKIYLFDRPKVTGYVVGSANLTARALINNSEVVSAGMEVPENMGWNDAWTEIMRQSGLLTRELLQEYRRRRRPGLRLVNPEPRATRPVIRAAGKPVFWDAITTGSINPVTFVHFWVQAGSMPSGGSHNQLELPRGGNRFFGFAYDTYGSAHVTIGFPTFILKGRTWTDRRHTWHGHNRMERVNLPTQSQGGFDYRNTAVLFRRRTGAFEITVFPWGDDVAVAWRAASEARGTVFRLGERGQRICGLF